MKNLNRKVRKQAGVLAVEFAPIAVIVFMMILGTIEIARALYLFNTLQESTRRAASAAAITNYNDQAKMDAVRRNAVFRASSGLLDLGSPVTDGHIQIDYLALVRNSAGGLSKQAVSTGDMAPCPARNREICMSDPNDARCIRFVRVRICAPGSSGACNAVPYESLTGLIKFPIDLPTSTTIIPAESLGYVVGTAPTC